MLQVATITSKMQLTLPVSIARKIGLKSGQKVAVSEKEGKITLTPIRSLIEELAGSVTVPSKLKGKSVDGIIHIAKSEHFSK